MVSTIALPRLATNGDVASAWRAGLPGHSGHMWTDGKSLYSYWLRIGFTTLLIGKKVLLDMTSAGGRGYSMTTSHHVALSRSSADIIVPGKNVCEEARHGYGWGQPTKVWIGEHVWDVEQGIIVDPALYASFSGCRERSYYDRATRTTVRVTV